MSPVWACAAGQDRYGTFASFAIGQVRQRMRWIPAGPTMMGSPDDEVGRYDDETHFEVTTQGYWIADTPVTQALWSAVMGANPSRFQHPDRPVEQINWHEACDFIARLNQAIPGMQARLPEGKEWERACRAATITATYAGHLEVPGAALDPTLDAIAWYAGNSGVDFDLSNGEPTEGWPEARPGFAAAGTRIVGQKRPNAWGLYDMLGNVWEWCVTSHDVHEPAPWQDARGPDEAAYRIVRGGSWKSEARQVRAAYWYSIRPQVPSAARGFRLCCDPE